MEGIGAEISQKIRMAIKAKLEEIGVRVDEELPDYVMVMVANKRSKEQMDEDLQLFLGENTSFFTTWLHHVLQKLQEVTVAKATSKRKQSEDSKKKKKSKQEEDGLNIIPNKKIKVEPNDNLDKEGSAKRKSTEENKPDEMGVQDPSNQTEIVKEKDVSLKKSSSDDVKDSNNIAKSDKQHKDSTPKSTSHKPPMEESREHNSKSPSGERQLEDFDDEDFINIRTDGELLDGAEDNVDESTKRKSKENEKKIQSKSDNDSREKKSSSPERESPPREKSKSKPSEKVDKPVQSITSKILTESSKTSPKKSPEKSSKKLVDARELLNRKKAARQAQNRAKSRSRSKSDSPPPIRRRRDDDREINYRNDRKRREEEERDIDRRANRDRDTRDRNLYSIRSRIEDRLVRRTDSKRVELTRDRRTVASNDPPSNKRSFNQRLRSRKFTRSDKDDYDDFEEEPVVKGGMVSRVVPREPSPEAEVDTPLPSVVKVTPRPRRPPSQQPSSTLIMKAISDANKSLANVPQRPDSTQQPRKEEALARKKRHRERIPPEKISVSISNPLAVYIESESKRDEDEGPPSPKYDPSAVNRSPPPELLRLSSQAVKKVVERETSDKEEWEAEEKMEEVQEPDEIEKVEEYVPECKPKLKEVLDEPMDELSDPQFVVTLNGYDPDGLFSHDDEGDEEDEESVEGGGGRDSWFKCGEQPLLTSTRAEAVSPTQQRSAPLGINNSSTANHSNLIEVDVLKKSIERCKYWPACRLGDKCTFHHPTKTCNSFPNCKFGDACLFIHPQCKFNALCTRKDCIFAHTVAPSPLQAIAIPKPIYTPSALLPCKFYPNCTNINCPFTHPSRVCKFGLYCTKKGCAFDHGKVAPVDKLKWTRVSTT